MPLPRLTRRRFLTAAGVTAASGLGALGYALYVEPGWTEVVYRDMDLSGLPSSLAGKRLVHISDLHVGSTDPVHLTACFQTVSDLRPDLAVITGDFMTCAGYEQVDEVPRLLHSLPRPPLGCLAVLGNHDYTHNWHRVDVADRLVARLGEAGVRVLRNEVVEVDGLQVAGLDELWAGRCRPVDAVRHLDTLRPALALCHNPDGVDRTGWDGFAGWVLAGHTHGGQCRLPWSRPPVTHLRNPTYWAGAFDLGNGRQLYVNRGLGYVTPLRFNARPEITVFTLAAT